VSYAELNIGCNSRTVAVTHGSRTLSGDAIVLAPTPAPVKVTIDWIAVARYPRWHQNMTRLLPPTTARLGDSRTSANVARLS